MPIGFDDQANPNRHAWMYSSQFFSRTPVGWDDKWILGACEGIEDVFDEAGGVHTARAQLAIYFTYGIIIFFAVILSLFKLYIYYNR